MKTKRKYLIIFFIILAALLAIGLLTLFFGGNGLSCSGKVLYQKGRRQQQNKSEEYQTMLPGLWQKGTHVYYRFNNDGTGYTWDTDDDLTENEASPFHWKISNGSLMLTHQLRMTGFIPRMYHIDAINDGSMQFHDPYSDYTLTRLNR